MIAELITGAVSTGAGMFFIALAAYGWNEVALFITPEESTSMKVMLILVALLGAVFLSSGVDILTTL